MSSQRWSVAALRLGLGVLVVWGHVGCQGELSGPRDLSAEADASADQDGLSDARAEADDGPVVGVDMPAGVGMEPPPDHAFLASSHVSELELSLSVVGGVGAVEGLRDVALAEALGTYVVGEGGLYEVIDQSRVRLKVAGQIDALETFGARALLLLMGGEAYLFEGGDLRLVLGGVLERGEATALMRRGDEVWVVTTVGLWRLSRDPLRGDALMRYALPGDVEALWGSARSRQIAYRLVGGELGMLELGEVGGVSQLTALETGGMLGQVYPSRDERALAVLDGGLAEWADGRWWWRVLDTTRPTTIHEVGDHAAHDSRDGATWFVSGERLWRVESGWSAASELPGGLREAGVSWVKVARDGSLWVMSQAGALHALKPMNLERPPLLDPPTGPVTFTAHIRPIAQASCVGCHVTGQGGAVVRLEDYDDWRSELWFPVVVQSVRAGRMPKESELLPGFADLLEQWRHDGFLQE